MAHHGSRLSTYSTTSVGRSANASSNQVSTQTLLNSLHTSYSSAIPLTLESSTSLVVNTWLTAASESRDGSLGGTVDADLAKRAWEHARRRAEDGCVVLGSLHESTPSLLQPFISAMPFSTPEIVYTALSALEPFLTSATPQNPATARHSSLAVTLSLALDGSLSSASLKLSSSGINTQAGLLNIASEHGNRAFDVFYYLLSSASSSAEREFLGLRNPSTYALLKKSSTYQPPPYLPTADDAAAADEWRACLKAIGITGQTRRELLSVLAALLKIGDTLGYLIDEEDLESTCEDAASLLGLNPETLMHQCSTDDRAVLIGAIYEALVDWLILKANHAISREMGGNGHRRSSSSSSSAGPLTPGTSDDDEDTVCVTLVELPDPHLGKAIALRNIFDDSEGINAEMKLDGVAISSAGHSVLSEMQTAVAANEPALGIMAGHAGRERELELDRREQVVDRVAHETEADGFLRKLLLTEAGQRIDLGRTGRFDLPTVIGSSRVWFHLCLHPTDDAPSTLATSALPWSAGSPSRQLRSWRLAEWANRRNKQLDFTADFEPDEFCTRYARLGCKEGRDGIESFILERGWSNGEVTVGTERIWIREAAWWEAETMLDMLPADREMPQNAAAGDFAAQNPHGGTYFQSPFGDANMVDSQENLNLLQANQGPGTLNGRARSLAPTTAMTARTASGGDYGLGRRGDEQKGALVDVDMIDPELADPKAIVEQQMTVTRRIWIAVVWAITFWVPSFMLRGIGGMKRPDVRMAWREKIVLVLFIFLLNAAVVFYIIELGHLLCPNFDKAWDSQEVAYHTGSDDFYVSTHGKVYDISKFWRIDHSNVPNKEVTSAEMQPLGGQNVDPLFPVPLSVGCPSLVTNDKLALIPNVTAENANVAGAFIHTSGVQSTVANSTLSDPNWFSNTFLQKMKEYYKGDLVYKPKDVQSAGTNQQYQWAIIHDSVYDLSDYFYTQNLQNGYSAYKFLDPAVEDMFQSNPGSDISKDWDSWAAKNGTGASENMLCMNNVFYVGKSDFRDSARCQVNNYILLSFTIIVCAVILIKFLSALQLGSKKRPSQQDKFVICQVPAYTEGEDHLRKGLDSLTALAYDNKRKLLCVICDGMIVGSGNDRPTPKIVLDILGVDPKIDPPALPFKSVGSSSEQLNYGKVYSGLYEFEGNVVPYLVIVKVGKESEQAKAKPGNRGKRDSQIMLMSFLNRVHHRSPMSPLELEMFHQINNIIGVDPELYEYLFMVDADTLVKEDALNRLVAACANDAKIAGICGETSLENEERSWWTMIQVYEYYISHHLTKAFESLFGSVTCLPGCFTMYRLRTADKGKPLIISDKVINEYSICDVDTLHKKNLLSLGEDRFLTTLMTKHFPTMSYKFVPDAYAQTAAPETWGVLLSQRRRWINSTIHNLAELVFLKDLCGFCCFSMRFVVFIDLVGTLILPATCAYLGYLIYRVASHQGAFPLLSLIIIAAVYGLQAIIFLIKRQWQHIGWMIIYLLAFPIYSFVLPIYSFWMQDDFSWGNTRIVIGEKGSKAIVALEDEGFDPRSIPLQSWDDYALINNLPGRRGMGPGSEKGYEDGYEMDDIRSVYSSAKPASTVLTGFKSHQPSLFMPPQSPAVYGNQQMRPLMQQRQSGLSNFSRYTDHPSPIHDPQQQMGYMPSVSEAGFPMHGQPQLSPYNVGSMPYGQPRSPGPFMSQDNLLGTQTPPFNRASTRSPATASVLGLGSRPASVLNLPNFQDNPAGYGQPSDVNITEAIQACLLSVDLDTVNKRQLKSLAEQRLGVQLTGEKKAFLDRQIDVELANM